MQPRLLPVLLAATLAACAAHPAAAAGPPLVDAVVGGLVMEGTLTLEGPLSAAASTGHFESADPTRAPFSALVPVAHDQRVPPNGLSLAARQLRVETDVERRSGSPYVDNSERNTEAASFADAAGTAAPSRPGFQFYVAPLPGHAPPLLRFEATQARLQPVLGGPDEPSRIVVATDRPRLLPAPGPAAVATGGLRTVHIEGDFVLTLWEWDLDLTSAGALVRSGYFYTPAAPSVSGHDTLGDSESRQAYLYAEGATLDLTLPYEVSATFAFQPSAAHLDGRLVLERPDGRLAAPDGDHALRDGDWVDGDFRADLAVVSADSLHARLSGTGRQAFLAGLTVSMLDPAPSSAGPLMALVAAAGLTLLGSWRMWGRRRANPALSVVDTGADDELRTLRWLEERVRQAAVLWDSDLMRAFDWSAERAQGVLHALQAKGEVRCKDVALAPGRSSLGHITLTAAGADRLRGTAGGGGGGGRRLLRRIAADLA